MNFRQLLGLILLTALISACGATAPAPVSEPGEGSIALEEADAGEMTPQAEPEADPPQGWVVVERTFTQESEYPRYVIDARWPNLEGDSTHTGQFNEEVDRRVSQAMEVFLERIDARDDGREEQPTSTLTLDYELTYQSEELVSVYLMFDTYIALSAHPFPSAQSLNYDVSCGRFVALANLFAPEIDPLAVILASIEPALLTRDLGYTAGVAEAVLMEREHWNVLPEGLRINFEVYEVGPYAAGHQYILIPWADLSPSLDPDGPASALMS